MRLRVTKVLNRGGGFARAVSMDSLSDKELTGEEIFIKNNKKINYTITPETTRIGTLLESGKIYEGKKGKYCFPTPI